jgi:formiminoglutamase
MTQWKANLRTRITQNWASLFDKSSAATKELMFYLASSDIGVIRNGGRQGARHAPQTILHHFKKLVTSNAPYHCKQVNVAKSYQIEKDLDSFELDQKSQLAAISTSLKNHAVHLGGGHDHIYPFAMAVAKKFDHLHVINIDAHLDTRQDSSKHSGTPFRQLHQALGDKLSLTQIGIRSSANVSDKYQDIKMSIYTMEDLERGALDNLKLELKPKTALILSIDCDGIDSSLMSAVSAPNPYGLTRTHLNKIKEVTKSYWHRHDHLYVGFYEYNPLFDNISATNAKFLAHYLNELIS